MNDSHRWMKKLADHYRSVTRRFPEAKHMIVFDVDGTILDSRYMIRRTLQSFDRHHGTAFFRDLSVADITFPETALADILVSLGLPGDRQRQIVAWYTEHGWSAESVMEAHRPFIGVMEVIRWFQIQPNTLVGLNSGRSESVRAETLCCLNKIGRRFKVNFTNDLLYLNRNGWDGGVVESKLEGMLHFQKAGYRLFAFVDNEPENLEAVASMDGQQEIMLLHADTIFRSQRKLVPHRAVSGDHYDVAELFAESSLPGHIQFVWHSISGRDNFMRFLTSNVQWAEFPVRLGYDGIHLVVRNDSYDDELPEYENDVLYLKKLLPELSAKEKSIKIDMKEETFPVDQLIALLQCCGCDDTRLWFNGKIEALKEKGFRKLAAAYPRAILQCPADDLVPLMLGSPATALSVLDTFRSWGINRVSISWKTPFLEAALEKLERWGFEVNIYNVPDLESFLSAVLMLPQSITSDFNFTPWLQEPMKTPGRHTAKECRLSGMITHPGTGG
jgi:hypothetical protein